MPITLGCPSCGKRFRARDESAGKKVKCPYCQAAVQVPTPEEAASAGAPTAPLPPPPPFAPAAAAAPRTGPPARAVPPPAPVVASPDDWGALPTGPGPAGTRPAAPAPLPPPPPAPPPAPEPELFPPSLPGPGARGAKERPKPARPAAKGNETPEEVLAAGWKTVRRGLFWVQFALLMLSLIGFIGFGKMVAERTGNPLPSGEGWVKIEGYVNSSGNEPNAIKLNKTEELDAAMYGIPILIAGVFLTFGRLVASGGPRSSGSRGLFALSGLFLLLGLVALLLTCYFQKLDLREQLRYTAIPFLLLAPLAEFWFLVGLTACGLALKRPSVARAVGFLAFVATLGAFAATLGWELYKEYGRPRKPNQDILLYEQAALMVGWLLLIGGYWRAVRGVRVAAQEYIDAVEVRA